MKATEFDIGYVSLQVDKRKKVGILKVLILTPSAVPKVGQKLNKLYEILKVTYSPDEPTAVLEVPADTVINSMWIPVS